MKIFTYFVRQYNTKGAIVFNIITQDEIKSDYGGNIHNYGIEWCEDVLCGTTYSRFTNEMEKLSVYKEYSFDAIQTNEIYSKDLKEDNLEQYYIDNVDTSVYIGHGSGDGLVFETSTADNILTCKDISKRNGWGNRDLEFKTLLSCKVLQENYNGQNWAQRWGPCFNGLHLLCGFQSNANVGEHNLLKFFAENQYTKNQSVRMSWINAANNDQPSGTQVVVMGPLINNHHTTNFNSVPSAINGLNRAYWNDHTWGISNGPGLDISKTDIKGWWRIVFTV